MHYYFAQKLISKKSNKNLSATHAIKKGLCISYFSSSNRPTIR